MCELNNLRVELEKVQCSQLEFLPEYGYSAKSEVIELIEAEIEEMETELFETSPDYSYQELEYERTQLCYSQGISRY